MAENTVVKEQLTDAMVDAGEALTRKLDELGLPVQGAFWFFDTEINEWALVFSSPAVSVQGPLALYMRINEAIEQLGSGARPTPLSVVRVLEPEAEPVKWLRMLVQTGPGIGRVRCTRNAVNGHFIEDALIYRMN